MKYKTFASLFLFGKDAAGGRAVLQTPQIAAMESKRRVKRQRRNIYPSEKVTLF